MLTSTTTVSDRVVEYASYRISIDPAPRVLLKRDFKPEKFPDPRDTHLRRFKVHIYVVYTA